MNHEDRKFVVAVALWLLFAIGLMTNSVVRHEFSWCLFMFQSAAGYFVVKPFFEGKNRQ